jgi:hypothetical protein
MGVEPGRAAGVHGHDGSVVRRRPARPAQLRGIGSVEGRVGGGGDGAGGGGPEQAAAEEVAVTDADGVRTCGYTWSQCMRHVEVRTTFVGGEILLPYCDMLYFIVTPIIVYIQLL